MDPFTLMLGLGLASAAASVTSTVVNGASQRRQQANNYELQQESLQLQKEQFAYQQDYDIWQKNLAERNFQLQSSPISSLVKDGSSVGVNPMAALGQNIGSASVPSSNVNTSFGVGSVPLMDTGLSSMLSMMSNIITTGMNVKAESDIAKQNQALRQQELDLIREKNINDYELGKESNSIHSRFASVSEKDLERMKAKDAHDMLVDDRQLLLQKIDQAFYRKLSKIKYSYDKEKFSKEFEENKRQFNASLSQRENEIKIKWDNLSTFERNRLIYRYIKTANDDVMHFFGKGLFSSGEEPYMDTHIGFGAYGD